MNLKKQKLAKLLLILLGVILHLGLYAQGNSVSIKGQVKDTSGETVIGASVMVKGATTGTITDYDGFFQINASINATLVISYIGYQTKEIVISGQKDLLVVLTEDQEMLSEVVVIGYGQVKKGEITGSLTTITPDELNKGKQLTPQDALVGKVSGVSVVPGSGAPGDGGTIRIRMGASLSASNDPLIVIDGIPVADMSLSSINPNDIETFTVLKDASATAIYGSRASNGVVIITTKKGSTIGGKPRINYSSNYSLSEVTKRLDVLSADEFRDAFKKHAGAPDSFQLGTASTNWQDEVYRTAFGTDHNLSVTGSTKQIPYRLSVGYTNQSGVVKENNYERINASLGLSPKFFDKHLSVDINIKASIENEHPVSSGIASSASSFDPTRPIYETYPDNMGLGYFMWTEKDGSSISQAASNPVADLVLANKLNKTKRSIGNLALNYKIHGFEDLQLNINAGYDVRREDKGESIPQFAPSMYTSNQNNGTGKVYNEVKDYSNYLLTLYANYNREFNEKHTLSVMGGYDWQRFWKKSNDSTYDPDGNQLVVPSHSEGELYLLSFYGRLNYTFAQKLLLTATLRADASSRFGKDHRWGYFPSVAAAYRLNEEDIFKNINALSDLKVRLSYGQTGQQDIGSFYQHLGKYTSSLDNSRYQFGNDWTTLYRPDGFDPKIKWETTTTYNFGLDFGFLNNRIYGSVDAYTRKTTDLLNSIFVPAGSNFTNRIDTNIGDMKGKGLELSLSLVPVKTKDWEWTVSGNFTWNDSEITKLNLIDDNDTYVKTGGAGGTGNYLQVHKIGETPYTFFLLQQAYGEDGKPLDGKYLTPDGEITSKEDDANKYVTGKSSTVPYYYGLSTRVNYKNWDLGMNSHGSFGNYVFNYPSASDSFDAMYGSNTSSNIMRSTLETGFTQKRLFSDHFLEKGSFFKLDNITLGYSFKKLWNTPANMRVAFSVQNVFTITDYSGIDPEVYSGIDRNVYQRPRIYSLSLNLNF